MSYNHVLEVLLGFAWMLVKVLAYREHIPIPSCDVCHSPKLLRNRRVKDVILKHVHTHAMLDVEPVGSMSCCLVVLLPDT